MRVYTEIKKANKEIQVLLNVGLVPIVTMSFSDGCYYYGIGYYEGVNFR